MNKTRLSLFYLASYLWGGGLALLVAPQWFVGMLLSNAQYPDVMLMALGMFMVSLAIIVTQIIRARVEALYPTTLVVRLFILPCLLFLFARSGDPLFLALVAIVGLGVLITGAIYLAERRKA